MLGLDPMRLPVSPLKAPRRPIVGVSDASATTLREPRYIIDVIASYTVNINSGRVARGKSKLEPFVAIDLSAGMGAYLHEHESHVGSPLLLLEALERRALRYRMLLVDREPSVVHLLKQNLDIAMRTLQVDPSRVDVLEAEFTSAEGWVRRNVKLWCYGTNNPSMRELRQRGFVGADTVIGQERLDTVRFTTAERRRQMQPSFFDLELMMGGAGD